MYVNFTFYLKVKLKKLGSGKFLELVWVGFMGWKGILVEGETNTLIYKVWIKPKEKLKGVYTGGFL